MLTFGLLVNQMHLIRSPSMAIPSLQMWTKLHALLHGATSCQKQPCPKRRMSLPTSHANFACEDTHDASSEWHPVENLGGMHWGSPSQIEASSQRATGFKSAGRTAWSLASIVARRGGDGSPAERLCRLHLLWQRQ